VSNHKVRELQEQLSNLNALLEHRGYRELMRIAEEQDVARVNTLVLTPLKTMDEALEQEYAKGEIGGIRLFKAMIPTMVEQLQADIETELNRSEEHANTDEHPEE
jgi:hypothetical protein